MVSGVSQARRVRARALQTSAIGLALLLGTPAFAQCGPEPTQTNGTTTCTGTDSNGIRVTTSGTTLTVASGASVSNTGAPAIAINVPHGSGYVYNTVNVLGTVSAAGQNAIAISSGTVTSSGYYYGGEVATLAIGATGSVTGSTAISLQIAPGSSGAVTSADLDNAGILTGTSGTALDASVQASNGSTAPTSFSTINNRAGASINGSILGSVRTLTNAGTISGNAASALDTRGGFLTTLTNAVGGAIRSSSNAATILVAPGYGTTVTNAGTIANAGSGAVLSGGTFKVTNLAGGQISTAGATAITTTSNLTLTNRGTVTGNVVAGSGGSTIDSSAGTVSGSVSLGSGNNTLVARYAGGPTLATGVTGTIAAGGSTNTERVVFAADTSVTTRIDLNAGFQQLVLAPDAKVTATLESGFSTQSALVLAGMGTVVNRATISVSGTAVGEPNSGSGYGAFRNEGSISASIPSGSYSAGLAFSTHSFTNTGSVTVSGGTAVQVYGNPVVNSGTITASGTGVDLFDGVLTNSGTIVSSNGAGANLYGNVGFTGSNSGTIRGATTGAVTGIYLTNTGTIGSAGVGVAVQPYGYLINGAGGVVNGGSGGAVTVSAFNAGVANAGTINGNVTFNGSDYAGSSNNLTYIALTGGLLNGNLALGGGATLVTDLVNTGSGQFAGINGTVTAGSSSTLRYAVNADAIATLPAGNVGPFATVGYQLANGAALTLTAPAGQTRTQMLTLAGNGSVDLTASISTTGMPAIQSANVITYPGAPAAAAAGLSITSRGALSLTRTSSSAYVSGAVVLSAADSFTNAGNISVTDRTNYGAAIYGGASVTNAGSITLDGGVGISNVGAVTNTGTITQKTGGAAALGLTGFRSAVNSGTISVGGSAVDFGSFYSGPLSGTGGLTNSGTLVSTSGAAITSGGYSVTPQIINEADGTIAGVGRAVQMASGMLTNAGKIAGTVDLGYGGVNSRSYPSSTYVADGGTVSGDLLFGSGADLLVQTGDALGVSGVIDGGAGTDIFGRSLSTSGTLALSLAGLRNFEDALVQAKGADTVVTTTSAGTFGGNVYATGNGSVVNQATIAGALSTTLPVPPYYPGQVFSLDQVLVSLTNAGSVSGGVTGPVTSFTNSGSVRSSATYASAVNLYGTPALAFANSGTITQAAVANYYSSVSLSATSGITLTNSGRIDGGGVSTSLYSGSDATPTSLVVANSGSISSNNGATAANFYVDASISPSGGTVQIDNSGTISAQGSAATGGSAYAFELTVAGAAQPFTYALTNSGTISATAATSGSGSSRYATALIVDGTNLSGRITNAAGGTISATGDRAYAVIASDNPLTLVNAGTIIATGATQSYAIATFDAFANTVVNTGTITGTVMLAGGADTLDNAGTVTGAVTMGAGNDQFVQRVGGTVSGVVDGGDGTDSYAVDTTGGTTSLLGGQIANFERVTQTGNGTGTYSGTFGVNTIGLAGGTLSVATGQTLATQGTTSVTGIAGSGNLLITNAGTIAGGITLADGNDTVANNGTINGTVRLGAGDDTYVEGVGSLAIGGVDGDAGTNVYRVVLAGDRTGIGARTNFQSLAVDGAGTLALSLDQSFQSIALNGTKLSLALGGYSVGQIVASGPATQVTLDGDVGSVLLGAGSDTLALNAATVAGRYDGGAGNDTLRLTNGGPVTISGAATAFETLALSGNALTVTGSLGAAGQPLALVGGDKLVTVARGGVLAGNVDLGAGNDSLRVAAGGVLTGTISGGGGDNAAVLDLSGGDLTLRAATLADFQRLTTEGAGTLTLAGGSFGYETLTAAGSLTVAADANLTTRVAFGPTDNRFAIAGGFAGSVDGGAGNDSIDVSGGSAAAPVTFTNISSVEAFRMSGGFATVSGTASLGGVALSGGRLVGLAESSMTAATFTIGQAATFGSAGTINGTITVAGILSPGASPGTMTVNGNVTLASGSTSLFELTPTVSDKLVVNGSVSIGSGSTLQLVEIGTLRPGTSYTLITASNGITGAYTTVVKPADLFGLIVQRPNEIDLLGEFVDTGSFDPQVSRSIAYANGTLAAQASTSTLFAALPALLTSTDASNPQAFARLTPEPYATVTQMGVDNALVLVDAARGPSFATVGDGPHAYTFASILGQWHRLSDDPAVGTSAAHTQGYGFLGGVGYGDAAGSVGAFGGYLDNRQHIDALAARTKADGVVAGVQARLRRASGFGLNASVIYDGSQATTTRFLPDGTASGNYNLHSWIGDLQVSYEIRMPGDWALTPKLGVTYLRTTRDGVSETGNSPFALTVARNRHVAGFADGAVAFGRGEASVAPFRPFVAFGLRYQIEGTRTDALAGYAGGGLGLEALGAPRARVVGTASGGVSYRLPSGLDIFTTAASQTGSDDHQESVTAGVRMRF